MKTTIFAAVLGLLSLQFAISGQAQPPNGLPENAKVELRGTLQVFIRENLEAQTADFDYYLDRGKGKGPVKLIFLGDHPSNLQSGVGIAVRGQVRNGNVEVTVHRRRDTERNSGDINAVIIYTQGLAANQLSFGPPTIMAAPWRALNPGG